MSDQLDQESREKILAWLTKRRDSGEWFAPFDINYKPVDGCQYAVCSTVRPLLLEMARDGEIEHDGYQFRASPWYDEPTHEGYWHLRRNGEPDEVVRVSHIDGSIDLWVFGSTMSIPVQSLQEGHPTATWQPVAEPVE